MSKITVKADQARCVWFTAQEESGKPSGQQCSQWLPAGDYMMIGRETITVSERGVAETAEFVRFHNEKGSVYYVHPNFLKGVDIQFLPVLVPPSAD
jgi:hypothetical protein